MTRWRWWLGLLLVALFLFSLWGVWSTERFAEDDPLRPLAFIFYYALGVLCLVGGARLCRVKGKQDSGEDSEENHDPWDEPPPPTPPA